MRIVAISDTHGRHEEIQHKLVGDILICAGDVTYRGRREELKDFCKWGASLDFKHKIIVAGNHDFCIQNKYYHSLEIMAEYGFIYLEDSGTVLDGVRIWGSPWTPKFGTWAFMLPEIQLVSKFGEIPSNTDILITHSPPNRTLDKFNGYPNHVGIRPFDNLGSIALKDRVEVLPNLKAHVFGHIHEGYGESGIFHNVAICDINYEPVNAPTVFDVA